MHRGEGEVARQQAIEQRERVGEFGFFDHQRRREQEQVAARGEGHALGHRRVDQRLQRGRRLRPRRERRAVARSATSSITTNRPWPPRTSPMTAWRVLQALQLREQLRAERARARDQAFFGVGSSAATPAAHASGWPQYVRPV
jgi:hypothetical protein